MAVKKHKLEMAMEEDFCLLGLVTDEPDYKLCWRINEMMGSDFKRVDDLELYHRKMERDQSFPLFCYLDADALVNYRIIGNRSDHGYFLEELKNLDYLIHIQGEISMEEINQFLQQTAALPGVRICVPVDLGRLRNMERLLLW